MADPITFPMSANFFIPSDNFLSPTTTTSDLFILPYHIVPQRLSFPDLQKFKAFYRFPTLILDKSILITNNSVSNFTLGGSRLTHPDMYTNAAIAIHGIDKLLDYSVFGAEPGKNYSEPTMVASPGTPPPPPRIFVPSAADNEELTVHHGESDAACLCTELDLLQLQNVVIQETGTKSPLWSEGSGNQNAAVSKVMSRHAAQYPCAIRAWELLPFYELLKE
ncbi:hypothetical protein SADUNF_Sadunf11G0115400 [Salix dunnii]|uniref:FAS1 domain-containing protein n=1 Tax=Salix dunnii TaxID=1413687 RepID=A0A835MXG1_9ROSI|nr:hypothetical protein SADUNF_Sadunf11G0115400 [Salix dunnii]